MNTLEPIKSFWFGEELSKLEIISIRSFLAFGHPYQLYCYKGLKGIPDGVEVKDASEIIPQSKITSVTIGEGKGSLTVFADLFRYLLLHKVGGYWVDLDIICLKAFDFKQARLIASERSQQGSSQICNAVIKALVADPLMQSCAAQAALLLENPVAFGATANQLVAGQIKASNDEIKLLAPAIVNPVDFWNFATLLSVNPPQIPSQSYAVHFWNELWRRSGRNKNMWYSSSSLYGKLQRIYCD